jgi:hypothetical protein
MFIESFETREYKIATRKIFLKFSFLFTIIVKNVIYNCNTVVMNNDYIFIYLGK